MNEKLYGIYPYAVWSHDRKAVVTRGSEQGYVVRDVNGGVPYSRMKPVKVYRREGTAIKACALLNTVTNYGHAEPNYGESSVETAS